jgi:hypothetical protein
MSDANGIGGKQFLPTNQAQYTTGIQNVQTQTIQPNPNDVPTSARQFIPESQSKFDQILTNVWSSHAPQPQISNNSGSAAGTIFDPVSSYYNNSNGSSANNQSGSTGAHSHSQDPQTNWQAAQTGGEELYHVTDRSSGATHVIHRDELAKFGGPDYTVELVVPAHASTGPSIVSHSNLNNLAGFSQGDVVKGPNNAQAPYHYYIIDPDTGERSTIDDNELRGWQEIGWDWVVHEHPYVADAHSNNYPNGPNAAAPVATTANDALPASSSNSTTNQLKSIAACDLRDADPSIEPPPPKRRRLDECKVRILDYRIPEERKYPSDHNPEKILEFGNLSKGAQTIVQETLSFLRSGTGWRSPDRITKGRLTDHEKQAVRFLNAHYPWTNMQLARAFNRMPHQLYNYTPGANLYRFDGIPLPKDAPAKAREIWNCMKDCAPYRKDQIFDSLDKFTDAEIEAIVYLHRARDYKLTLLAAAFGEETTRLMAVVRSFDRRPEELFRSEIALPEGVPAEAQEIWKCMKNRVAYKPDKIFDTVFSFSYAERQAVLYLCRELWCNPALLADAFGVTPGRFYRLLRTLENLVVPPSESGSESDPAGE